MGRALSAVILAIGAGGAALLVSTARVPASGPTRAGIDAVAQELDAGDHLIFIGEVTDGSPPAPGTKPLMYFRRTYGTWED